VNLNLGARFRKIANNAQNGSTSGPNNVGAFQRLCSRRRATILNRFSAIIYCPVVNGGSASRCFHLQFPLQMCSFYTDIVTKS
jgi:hypothetical protein